MIFIDNKYTKWYKQIISNSANRQIGVEYVERHHILPKSLGGGNAPTNMAILSPKEHFVCHLLLTKMTDGKDKAKMVFAARMMVTTKNDGQDHRYKVTGRIYDIIKRDFSKIKRGIPLTQEVRSKISRSLTGKTPTLRMTGQTHSTETRLKMRVARRKQEITEETKQKLSAHMKAISSTPHYVNPMDRPNVMEKHKTACLARSSNKKICPHCSQLFSANTFALWHGENCKKKGGQ